METNQSIKKPVLYQKQGVFTNVFLLPCLALVAVAIYIVFAQWCYDDSFITYRYAHNLAGGRGFVYNPGLQVQSTSTPLFTMILAAIFPFWEDLPHLANLIGALSLAIGALFLWDLGSTWNSAWVGWAGLLLFPIFPLLVQTLGSETPLYLAFCLGAFAFYARKQYTLAGLLSALAVLTRPDGILVPILLTAHFLLNVRRPMPWKAILVFLALTLTWYVFAWSYFGSPIPITLATKQHQGAMAISQRFLPGLYPIMRPYFQQWYFWLSCLLAVLGIFWAARRARAWWLIFAWTGLYFTAYTLLGVSGYFWYYAPLVPGLVIAIGLGVEAIQHALNARGRQAWELPVSAAIVLALAFGQCATLWRMSQKLDPRLGIYRVVGEWLRDNTPPDALVGALEIGAIGYYSDRPIVDFAGLIQPEAALQLKANTTYADSARWAVQQYKPDYVVVHKAIFPELEAGYLAQSCQNVKRFDGAVFGYRQDLLIYNCR